MAKKFLSYDVAVIQWITLCHKSGMTTRVITLWRVHVMSLTTSVSTIHFLIEMKLVLKAVRSIFKVGWLVGLGFNGPLRQYVSLYRTVFQREGERGKKR